MISSQVKKATEGTLHIPQFNMWSWRLQSPLGRLGRQSRDAGRTQSFGQTFTEWMWPWLIVVSNLIHVKSLHPKHPQKCPGLSWATYLCSVSQTSWSVYSAIRCFRGIYGLDLLWWFWICFLISYPKFDRAKNYTKTIWDFPKSCMQFQRLFFHFIKIKKY